MIPSGFSQVGEDLSAEHTGKGHHQSLNADAPSQKVMLGIMLYKQHYVETEV